LLACSGEQPVDGEPDVRQASTCDSAEEQSVTDAEGVIHDVRIVQFRKTRLFVPADWIPTALSASSDREETHLRGDYEPVILKDECPGIVHVARSAETECFNDLPHLAIRMDGRLPPKGLKSDTIQAIFVSENVSIENPRMRFMRGSGIYNTFFVSPPDIFLFISDFEKYPSGGIQSESLRELVAWLETPPAERENDRVFDLRIDTAPL
jgi:hypothetical protein